VKFSGPTEAREGLLGNEVGKLHAKIGQLVVKGDFPTKASGRPVSSNGVH